MRLTQSSCCYDKYESSFSGRAFGEDYSTVPGEFALWLDMFESSKTDHALNTVKMPLFLQSRCTNLNPGGNADLKCCCWPTVITEEEFYGSRTSSAQELCERRTSNNGNNVAIAAATYRSSAYAAQNSTPTAGYSAHALLTYMSSLSAPDVHQVTSQHCFLVLCQRFRFPFSALTLEGHLAYIIVLLLCDTFFWAWLNNLSDIIPTWWWQFVANIRRPENPHLGQHSQVVFINL